jgi:predicted nuclease of predicted toxin-antitoxin system
LKLFELAFLADENIHPEVVDFLRCAGFDVAMVKELGLAGSTDRAVLMEARRLQRAVLTHDSDFGSPAIAGGLPVFGIVYLRPGHIRSEFTIATLRTLIRANPDITRPFVLVATRKGDLLRIRLRSLTTAT